ncbi:FkbM family methyltransferase [Candidatus Laterigemmans baculatus]|uniref:FkbM family methyltransferase n=1 Tax=Candidatus Laterigemmans baculatus TaxID=2770505 RepID=UPI0028F3F905|nr:FkbM family methyltransferase [Candidatus Laterigemmans baculatus]
MNLRNMLEMIRSPESPRGGSDRSSAVLDGYESIGVALTAEGQVAALGRTFEVTDAREFAHMFRCVFVNRSYEFRCDRQDPRIIDCGANLGVTVHFWKCLFPQARVTAFEPDPAICRMLRENCSGLNSVEVIEAAVWNEDGQLLFKSQGGVGGHLRGLTESTTQGGELGVRAVRLRDLLGEPVDLLKIDIEGAEIDVLHDCAERLVNVDRLFVEYHAFVDRPQRLAELVGILEQAGYLLHVHSEMASKRPFLRRDVVNGKHHRLNIFASKSHLPEIAWEPEQPVVEARQRQSD